MRNTESLVKNALASTLKISDLSSIQLEDHLREDLQMDSMSSLMFLMKLEENINGFFVDPETLQMSDLETVSSVINYIDTQVFPKGEHVH